MVVVLVIVVKHDSYCNRSYIVLHFYYYCDDDSDDGVHDVDIRYIDE